MTTSNQIITRSALMPSAGLGPNEVDMILNSCGTQGADLSDDVVDITTCSFPSSMTVFVNHVTNVENAVGLVRPRKEKGMIVGRITIDPEYSPLAAQVLRGLKSGILNSGSIGFRATDRKPIAAGGYRYIGAKIVEFSIVGIGSDPGAKVTAKARHDGAGGGAKVDRHLERRAAALGIVVHRPDDDAITANLKMRARLAAL